MLFGTALMGAGVALVLRSRLGLLPLDVLHQAVAARTGWSLGTGIILTQGALVALWLPLRIRPGPATLAGVLVPGLTCDATLTMLPSVSAWPARWALLAAGGAAFALGVAAYLGARLGAIPRDGLILYLRQRGHRFGPVRVAFDVASLAAGWGLLGVLAAVQMGAVGAGSVLLALGLGPAIAALLPHWDRCPPPGSPPRHRRRREGTARVQPQRV